MNPYEGLSKTLQMFSRHGGNEYVTESASDAPNPAAVVTHESCENEGMTVTCPDWVDLLQCNLRTRLCTE